MGSSRGTHAAVQVGVSHNVKDTGWVVRPDSDVDRALEEAETAELLPDAKPPTLTPIYGYTFCNNTVIRAIEPDCFLQSSLSSEYPEKLAKFHTYFPMSDTNIRLKIDSALAGDLEHGRGYWEARASCLAITSPSPPCATPSPPSFPACVST